MSWATTVSPMLLLATGLAGLGLARLIRLPGGDLLGAMLAVAGLMLLVPELEPLPRGFSVAGQIMIGGVIGSQIRPGVLKELRPIAGRVVVLSTIILAMGVSAGLVFGQVTGIGSTMGVLALLPGGAADVTAVAIELGDEAPVAAATQGLRQLLVLGILGAAFRVKFRHVGEPLELPIVVGYEPRLKRADEEPKVLTTSTGAELPRVRLRSQEDVSSEVASFVRDWVDGTSVSRSGWLQLGDPPEGLHPDSRLPGRASGFFSITISESGDERAPDGFVWTPCTEAAEGLKDLDERRAVKAWVSSLE